MIPTLKEIAANHAAMVAAPIYEPATVNIDAMYSEDFPCFVPRYHWNGWEIPSLEKAAMDRLMAETNAAAAASKHPEDEYTIVYDAGADTYTFHVPMYQGEDMVVEGRTIIYNIGGERRTAHVYELDLGWCWDRTDKD